MAELISIAEARRRVLDAVRPLGAEEVPLAEALGRVLAEDVVAPVDVPGFDRSGVDGFAVRAGDTVGASAETVPLSSRPVRTVTLDELGDVVVDAPPRGRRRRSAPEREAEATALTAGEPPAEPDLLDDEPPHSPVGRPRRGRKAADAEPPDRADAGDEGSGDATAPDLETETIAEKLTEAEPAEDADKPRRRRRRSRRKKADGQTGAAAEAGEADDGASEIAPADAAGEDEEPAPEVIADWNVPSWNDLIASLYRPDR
jgi:hypothetical protein